MHSALPTDRYKVKKRSHWQSALLQFPTRVTSLTRRSLHGLFHTRDKARLAVPVLATAAIIFILQVLLSRRYISGPTLTRPGSPDRRSFSILPLSPYEEDSRLSASGESWFGRKAPYVRVSDGAFYTVLTQEPYIAPDMALLGQYRASQTIPISPGKVVQSSRYATIFDPKLAGPRMVLVMALDANRYSAEFLAKVLADRKAYCQKHGMGLYAHYLQDYDDMDFAPAKVVRHAMFAYPNADWMWYLDMDAVIMDPERSLLDAIYPAANIDMQKNVPLVPLDDAIRTYQNVPKDMMRFFVMQNDHGVSSLSFIVSNDDLFGKVMFDHLSDPLQARYQGFLEDNAQRPLDSAMTHMLQWHPVFLARTALLANSVLGSGPEDGQVTTGQLYKEGDFVRLLRSLNEKRRPSIEATVNDYNKYSMRVAEKQRQAAPN